MLKGTREQQESENSTSSGYWSQRNKLPVKLPVSKCRNRTGSMSPVRFRSTINQIRPAKSESGSDDSKDSKKTVKSAKINFLADRITEFLKSADPETILEYLLEKVKNKKNEIISAFELLFDDWIQDTNKRNANIIL